LANTAQAKKRSRQNETRRQRNTSARSMMRTSIKKIIKAIEAGDKTGAQTAYQATAPILDRLALKNLIHKNKATRHKSRLSKRIKDM
jgi:small subunit ribosomal protein S20